MIFRYAAPPDHSAGGYSFHLNEATVNTLHRSRRFNSRGRRRSTVVTLHVTGKLKEVYGGSTPITTQAELTAAISQMENNFLADLTDGSLAGLYLDDGVTPTSHILSSGDAMNGVQVLQISYPSAGGAEYTTLRTFGIVLQAEYAQTGLGGDIQAFRESIRTIGTGQPLYGYLPTWTGVRKFLLRPGTIQHVYQQGSVTAFSGSPIGIISPPVYPAYERVDERQIINISPTNRVYGLTDWTTRWSYHMILMPANAGDPPIPV